MQSLEWDVTISSSNQPTPFGNKNFHNIIATLDPEAPRRLTLVCHYDSKLTDDRGNRGFLGATDSAVPCSQMINIAYTMRRDLADFKNGAKNRGVSKYIRTEVRIILNFPRHHIS